jgi:hypothetical protein
MGIGNCYYFDTQEGPSAAIMLQYNPPSVHLLRRRFVTGHYRQRAVRRNDPRLPFG